MKGRAGLLALSLLLLTLVPMWAAVIGEIRHERVLTEAVARKDNGKARGPKNRGRPPKVRLTLDQWRTCLKLWRQYDEAREMYTLRSVVRSMIADYSTENGLKIEAENVKNDFLKDWFGARSDTSDREPPKQLWVKET